MTIKTVAFLSSIYALAIGPGLPEDTRVIETMDGAELKSLHNLVASNIGASPVNRFSDTTTARKRTWAILERYAESGPVDGGKPTKSDGEKTRRGMRFVFPAEDAVKPVREESARGRALKLLRREGGATFNEIMKVTGWNEKQAYEGIRLVHYYSGYGLAQSAGSFDAATTKIWAFTDNKTKK